MCSIKQYTLGACAAVFLFSASGVAYPQISFQVQPIGQSQETYGLSWGDMNSDDYPDLIYSNHRVAASLYINNADGTFSDRSDLLSGHNITADMHGIAWADIDNDGDADLYGQVGGSNPNRPNQTGEFYLNDGTRLVRQIDHELNYGEHRGRLPVWFDAENDGDLDVALFGYPPRGTSSGKSAVFSQSASNAFTNDSGLFNFSCDTTLKFGLLSDLTQNGNLDLVCGGPAFPTKIYQTNSTPFENKTGIVGLSFNSVVDAVSADFDGDQDNDIVLVRRRSKPANAYIVNSNTVKATAVVNPGEKGTNVSTSGDLTLSFSTNFLSQDINFGADKFHLNLQKDPNKPGKVYTVTLNSDNPDFQGLGAYNPADGISATEAGIYIGYIPAAGAGEWRLRVVSDKWSRFEYLAVSTEEITHIDHVGYNPDNDPISLKYLTNNGASGFSDNTLAAGLDSPITARSIVAADFDNDQDKDIFVVCEHEPRQCDHHLYTNDGNGKFSRSTVAAGQNGLSESVATADYNLDGCMDLATANGWFNAVYGASDHLLYSNDCTNGNKALEIDLVGILSNRDGTGATVEVTTDNKTQIGEQGNIYHRFSQNHKRLHFGLADNESASVMIRWPSGQTDTHPVDAGFLYRATEGGGMEPVRPLSTNASPRLFVTDAAVNETGPAATVAVNLVPANSTDVVSVDYFTQNGTASTPDDYTEVAGTLEFQPGETQKLIAVDITDDDEIELTEQFLVKLGTPVNAEIGDDTGSVTITDNDDSTDGTECGEPTFDKATEKGLFLWRDCNITETRNWHVRTTGGGSTTLISYEGSVSSNQEFLSVIPYRLEFKYDTLDDTDPGQIVYIMKMIRKGIDGFDFSFNPDANVCFNSSSQPMDAPVFLGSGRLEISGTLDLQNPEAACP